jgi:DNA-nicking Smr family endonuclease
MASLKDFADLKGLRNTLKDQEQARAVEKAEREKHARLAHQEANVFKHALAGVKPMPKSDRLEPGAPRAAAALPGKAKPRTQAEDDAAVLMESMLSDQFDVEHLLDDEPAISFLRGNIGSDVLRKLRKNYWPVQDELDLHNLRRDAAREAVGEFLHMASKRRLRCVCVIHGRGLGSAGGEPVLRSMVHSWLEQRPEVIAFCAADTSDGGHGALLVLLKAALPIP